MTKWIPVTERLPEREMRVLTFAPRHYYRISIHILRDCLEMDWWIGDQNFIVSEDDVTHWMPLPPEAE